MPASLLTFKRKDSQHDVSVVDSVRSINRQLERQFPDCTCCVLVVADPGTVSEGVTIELETTRESLASVDWYRKQAEALGLALTGWKRGQAIGLESEATSTFLPMPDAALCFPG